MTLTASPFCNQLKALLEVRQADRALMIVRGRDLGPYAASGGRWSSARSELAARNGNGGEQRPGSMFASEVLQFVTSRLSEPSILQIGGNETIGKGLCAVRFDAKKPSAVKESSS